MRVLLFCAVVIALCAPAQAQFELQHRYLDVPAYEWASTGVDTLDVATISSNCVVWRVVVVVDSAWTLSDGVSVGIGGRSTALAEFGTATLTELPAGTVIAVYYGGLPMHSGETIRLNLSGARGDAVGRVRVYVQFDTY